MKINTNLIKTLIIALCLTSTSLRANNATVSLQIENRAGELCDILPDALFESGGMPLSTVTDFIITGTMDARDFRYLFNSNRYFSALVNLDISESTLKEVTLDGTVYPDYEVPANAFDGFKTLQSILLPSTVTHIGAKAFAGCNGLRTMPNTITHIGNQAFAWARQLGDVVTSNSLIELGPQAYAYCDDDNQDLVGLSSIDLPATLTIIGNDVFANCNKLRYVIIRATTPPTINGGFGSNLGAKVGEGGTKPTLYVPDASVSAYAAVQAYSSAFIIKGISDMAGFAPEEIQAAPFACVRQNTLIVNNLTEGEMLIISDLQGRQLFSSVVTSPSVSWTLPSSNGLFLITVIQKNGNKITLKILN